MRRRSMMAKVRAQVALQTHLRAQYSDRLVYWGLRLRAQLRRDILVAILDGMDHSKFTLPRWTWGRAPKDAHGLERPHLLVHVLLLHGRGPSLIFCLQCSSHYTHKCCCQILSGTYIFIADEGLSSGSSFHMECVMLGRLLSITWSIA